MAGDDDAYGSLRAENARLRERVRWLENMCVQALRSIGPLTSELADRIEGTSPLRDEEDKDRADEDEDDEG